MLDSRGIARATDVVAMEDWPDPTSLPSAATYWKVTVRGKSSGIIDIKYSKVAHYNFVAGDTIETLMASLFSGTAPRWRNPQNKDPKRSRLSIENQDWRYQIFMLDSVNCHFSQDQVAFMIERGRKTYYRHPRSVWQDDVVGTVHHDREPPPGVNGQVAYFIDMNHIDPMADPAQFNIQLDVTDSDGGILPISVDPDVGYPGGHN